MSRLENSIEIKQGNWTLWPNWFQSIRNLSGSNEWIQSGQSIQFAGNSFVTAQAHSVSNDDPNNIRSLSIKLIKWRRLSAPIQRQRVSQFECALASRSRADFAGTISDTDRVGPFSLRASHRLLVTKLKVSFIWFKSFEMRLAIAKFSFFFVNWVSNCERVLTQCWAHCAL